MRDDGPLLYFITTHKHLPGARLSKRGHWGNKPCADVASAERAAQADAGQAAFKIERENFGAL